MASPIGSHRSPCCSNITPTPGQACAPTSAALAENGCLHVPPPPHIVHTPYGAAMQPDVAEACILRLGSAATGPPYQSAPLSATSKTLSAISKILSATSKMLVAATKMTAVMGCVLQCWQASQSGPCCMTSTSALAQSLQRLSIKCFIECFIECFIDLRECVPGCVCVCVCVWGGG